MSTFARVNASYEVPCFDYWQLQHLHSWCKHFRHDNTKVCIVPFVKPDNMISARGVQKGEGFWDLYPQERLMKLGDSADPVLKIAREFAFDAWDLEYAGPDAPEGEQKGEQLKAAVVSTWNALVDAGINPFVHVK